MIAFAMALLGCVLIMYKAIWYDQFTCPDGFLLRVRPGEQRGRLGSGAIQGPLRCAADPRSVPAKAGEVGCLPPLQGRPPRPP